MHDSRMVTLCRWLPEVDAESTARTEVQSCRVLTLVSEIILLPEFYINKS